MADRRLSIAGVLAAAAAAVVALAAVRRRRAASRRVEIPAWSSASQETEAPSAGAVDTPEQMEATTPAAVAPPPVVAVPVVSEEPPVADVPELLDAAVADDVADADEVDAEAAVDSYNTDLVETLVEDEQEPEPEAVLSQGDVTPNGNNPADPFMDELDRMALGLFGKQPPNLPPIAVSPEHAAGAPARVTPDPERASQALDDGNAFFNVGQFQLAVERYGDAIRFDDGLVSAWYNRANALARLELLDEALRDYNKAVELAPDDPDVLNNRGMVHLYRGDFPAALVDFDGALTLVSDDVTVRVNRGLTLLHLGEAERALDDFTTAIEQAPDDAAALYGAAQASARQDDRDGALGYLRRVFVIDRGYAREAAGDPMLAGLDRHEPFHQLLREFGSGS